MADRNPLATVAHGQTLAEAIVDTVREPLVVLDHDLRVIAASRSFYRTFAVAPQDTQGRRLYELGDGRGTFQRFGPYSKKSFRDIAQSRPMRSNTNSQPLDGA